MMFSSLTSRVGILKESQRSEMDVMARTRKDCITTIRSRASKVRKQVVDVKRRNKSERKTGPADELNGHRIRKERYPKKRQEHAEQRSSRFTTHE
jgi:hypothetical protein